MINKKRLPIGDSLAMIGGYAKSRIVGQIKSVAFIILYLVFFRWPFCAHRWPMRWERRAA